MGYQSALSQVCVHESMHDDAAPRQSPAATVQHHCTAAEPKLLLDCLLMCSKSTFGSEVPGFVFAERWCITADGWRVVECSPLFMGRLDFVPLELS